MFEVCAFYIFIVIILIIIITSYTNNGLFTYALFQAKEVLCEAKEADRSSVHTHFLCYKLALMESDTETGDFIRFLTIKCYTFGTGCVTFLYVFIFYFLLSLFLHKWPH